MITILLARHGQASFGKKNYDELSELGITQARMLGAHYAHTQRRIDGGLGAAVLIVGLC